MIQSLWIRPFISRIWQQLVEFTDLLIGLVDLLTSALLAPLVLGQAKRQRSTCEFMTQRETRLLSHALLLHLMQSRAQRLASITRLILLPQVSTTLQTSLPLVQLIHTDSTVLPTQWTELTQTGLMPPLLRSNLKLKLITLSQ